MRSGREYKAAGERKKKEEERGDPSNQKNDTNQWFSGPLQMLLIPQISPVAWADSTSSQPRGKL